MSIEVWTMKRHRQQRDLFHVYLNDPECQVTLGEFINKVWGRIYEQGFSASYKHVVYKAIKTFRNMDYNE